MRIEGKAFGFALTMGLLGLTDKARPFELFINPSFGSTENTGSTATLTFEFSEQGFDDLVNILIANTTPPAIGSRFTAVGLEFPDWLIQPPSLVPSLRGGYFDTLTYDESVSPSSMNGPGGYDLMISGDGDFFGGNPNGAPTAGASEWVTLSLGETGLTAEQLDIRFHEFYSQFIGPFALGRFQSVGPTGRESDMVGGSVPEPASIILLALGGLTLIRRRR